MELALIKIRRLELPASATEKVFLRMKAERMKEAQKIESAGIQEADVIKGEAESQRDQILALAYTEAEKIRSEGDAEAARYYKVFAENPELADYLRKIRALREGTRDNTTVILDTTTPPFDLLVNEAPTLRQKPATAHKAAEPSEEATQ